MHDRYDIMHQDCDEWGVRPPELYPIWDEVFAALVRSDVEELKRLLKSVGLPWIEEPPAKHRHVDHCQNSPSDLGT